jgi:hypothetical protein
VNIAKDGQHDFTARPTMAFGMTVQPCTACQNCDCGGGYVMIAINPPAVPDVLAVPVSMVDNFIAMIEHNRAKLLGQVS